MANPQGPGGPVNEDSAYIDSIANDVRRVVLERAGAEKGKGRRDVHRRHHGCVWAWFKIIDNIEPRLAQGVFQRGKLYPAWVRFSSSSKHAQPDPVGDGRGIAIKLLSPSAAQDTSGEDEAESEGPPASRKQPASGPLLPEGDALQDFLLLNGPAFFARDAKEMAIVAELEARDEFPSLFFASPARLAGLSALLGMARNQRDSLLQLTYHSQSPYQLGEAAIVKYRLRPRPAGPSALARVGSSPREREHYLFEALREELSPNPSEKADAQHPVAREHVSDVVFDFEVQLRGDPRRFPIDDATVVWPEAEQPFIAVAELRIPRQKFDTVKRMAFAEAMSFNPWHCLPEHEPVGSLNEARRAAYLASFRARDGLNRGQPGYTRPSYTFKEWHEHRANPGEEAWARDSFSALSKAARGVQALGAFFSWLGGKLLGPLTSTWGKVLVPLGVLALFLGYFANRPDALCAPFSLALFDLPSERLIPPAKLRPGLADTCGLQEDPKWLFRYFSTGSERHGGLPYWIYRVLPGMMPEYFGERGDWSQFGLEPPRKGRDGKPEGDEYYESYHELPRGLVLSDISYRIAGNPISLPMKVVSFNCASCHRGEYALDDEHKTRVFVDGMPNLSIDTAAYKVASIRAIRDDRFNAEDIIAAIDRVLAQEAQRREGDGQQYPTALNAIERGVYRLIVAQAKAEASAKPIDWVLARPHNGFGRLDAFGALRFEFMRDVDRPEPDQYIATVDLPSIWQQGSHWRPWHHWDGNTSHKRARNFGAIVGVGGNSLSIRGPEVLKVGSWIDRLPSPPYPFAQPDDAQVLEGEKSYTRRCASCHGLYSRGEVRPRPLELPGPLHADAAALSQRLGELRVELCTTQELPKAEDMCKGWSGTPGDVGTDRSRAVAVDADFVTRLNAFGVREGLWDSQSFYSTGRYIAPPLDGIWARAPYLHNGSVPTLRDLLGPAQERPAVFYRANPVYDPVNMGFRSEKPAGDGRKHLELDTARPGNCRLGHSNACQRVDGDERNHLIAYLKTL